MGSPFPVENRANLPDPEFTPLAAVLATHHSIKPAVDWLARHTPPRFPSDLVAQDKFSSDILVAYPGDLWLVYDVT